MWLLRMEQSRFLFTESSQNCSLLGLVQVYYICELTYVEPIGVVRLKSPEVHQGTLYDLARWFFG